MFPELGVVARMVQVAPVLHQFLFEVGYLVHLKRIVRITELRLRPERKSRISGRSRRRRTTETIPPQVFMCSYPGVVVAAGPDAVQEKVAVRPGRRWRHAASVGCVYAARPRPADHLR